MSDKNALRLIANKPAASLVTEIARTPALIQAAQRLRYNVFVRELGAAGDHAAGLERDAYDALADHLILRDTNLPKNQQVVGAYRMISQAAAGTMGGFYSETEFDLTPLRQSGQRLLELGRSCLHRDYRGGTALMIMWQALATYVRQHEIDVLFGVASFPGTCPDRLAHPLSRLHQKYLAPQHLRPTARQPNQPSPVPADQIDRVAAMRHTPSLIKGYLKLGGMIGQGVYVDRAFNTTDICMVLDTQQLTAHAGRYTQ